MYCTVQKVSFIVSSSKIFARSFVRSFVRHFPFPFFPPEPYTAAVSDTSLTWLSASAKKTHHDCGPFANLYLLPHLRDHKRTSTSLTHCTRNLKRYPGHGATVPSNKSPFCFTSSVCTVSRRDGLLWRPGQGGEHD